MSDRLFSVIYKGTVQDAFSKVLRYYVPDPSAVVVDTTCSVMKMWSEELRKDYQPVTFDIRKEIKPDFCCSCELISEKLKAKSVDCLIYDPPYLNVKNRIDSEWAKDTYAYGYEYSSFEYFEDLSEKCAQPFYQVLKKGGILMCKITNFHYKDRLRGTYDLKKWFTQHFFLWDEVVYRFFKHIANLNWYSIKVPKTHSYFLVFKKRKHVELFR